MVNDLSVVVNTRNRPNELRECLQSLANQETSRSLEIVVVDNSSTGNVKQLAKDYNAKYIPDGTPRLSHLFNVGWQNTSADFVAFVADDTVATPDWAEQIEKAFAVSNEVGIVGGPGVDIHDGEMTMTYLEAGRSPLLSLFRRVYETVIAENKLFEPGLLFESGALSIGIGDKIPSPRFVGLASTTNMAVRRSVLVQLRGFDENLLFNHTDGDLFVRARQAGYKILFSPGIRVIHKLMVSPSRDIRYIARDTAYFYMKDVRPMTKRGKLAFFLNVVFLNLYWVYTAASRNPNRLSALPSFAAGVRDYLRDRAAGRLVLNREI